LRAIKPFFTGLERENLVINGFYPDWAKPTYNLLSLLIIALAIVIAFPYLPGFNSPAFQGVSVFLGVLFSLGSTSAIANVVGGIILIYTRSFQLGDKISIGDVIGDVIEKGLLVTRIRTPANRIITIPNSSLLNTNVINFSVSQREFKQPLILQTTVTLGYDLPWRKVHATLKEAALATQFIVSEPAPFVLQTSLDDFYVSYQLNAYTDHPSKMVYIYSELHQNIQDKCNEVGIEIMSPHYKALRDGNHSTIPENYLPEDYQSPAFGIQSNPQK
jgi:small-conductance mechanosensitive channel